MSDVFIARSWLIRTGIRSWAVQDQRRFVGALPVAARDFVGRRTEPSFVRDASFRRFDSEVIVLFDHHIERHGTVALADNVELRRGFTALIGEPERDIDGIAESPSRLSTRLPFRCAPACCGAASPRVAVRSS